MVQSKFYQIWWVDLKNKKVSRFSYINRKNHMFARQASFHHISIYLWVQKDCPIIWCFDLLLALYRWPLLIKLQNLIDIVASFFSKVLCTLIKCWGFNFCTKSWFIPSISIYAEIFNCWIYDFCLMNCMWRWIIISPKMFILELLLKTILYNIAHIIKPLVSAIAVPIFASKL